MPLLRKASGGATVLGYTWARDGAVVEVTDVAALILLRIPDNDYSLVDPVAPSTFSEVVNDVPAVNAPIPRRPPTRKKE